MKRLLRIAREIPVSSPAWLSRSAASFLRFLAACLMLALVGCDRNAPDEAPAKRDADAVPGASGEARVELTAEATQAIGLETVAAVDAVLGEEIRATAVIKPNEYRMAHVSPRIPGKAIAVDAELGDVVAAGDVLAELDSIALGEKKAAFLKTRADLEVARRNYQREERLFGQHISSEKEYLEAKGEFERSQAAHRAAREALRLVGLSERDIGAVNWSEGKHPLSHFPLVAPLAGTVIERHITIGELIEPDESPYTIADLTHLWVLLDIYEKDLARVGVGDAVELRLEAYPDEVFRGRVTYLGSLLDSSTRTAQARVEIDNRDGRLRPGMFATATISNQVPGGREATTIPLAAVQRLHDEDVAFVEERPGVYVLRRLVLGRRAKGDVEVLAGVESGERVATAGAFYLKSTLLKEELGEPE